MINSDGKVRNVPIDSNFFTGYRKTILTGQDVVLSISIPKSKNSDYCLAYKQSRRREDDTAIVNMAIKVSVSPNKTNDTIQDIKLAYGGVGPQIVMPLDPVLTSSLFKFDVSTLGMILKHLTKYFKDSLAFDAPGGEVPYRQSLVLGLFHKAFYKIDNLIHSKITRNEFLLNMIDSEKPSALKSLQLFEKAPDSQPTIDTVGRPIVVVSGYKQSTGEAIFCDDIPRFENELALALVLSTKAHAKILKVDAEKALKQEGVRGFYSAKDLSPERNHWGLICDDETVFAGELVRCYGEVVGAIVADTKAQAQFAKRLVKIEYEELPAILTLEEAIQKKSFFNDEPMRLESGNVEQALVEAMHCIEGSFRTGKQEHFYLEPQASIVVPRVCDDFLYFIIVLTKIINLLLNLTEVSKDLTKHFWRVREGMNRLS